VISVQDAIASVNLVLLLIGTWVVFVFVKDILDEELAVVSAILFATSVQVLVFSVSVLTDGAGYTFLIAGMAGILLWAERKGPRAWTLVGVLVGLAMLAKETNIILLVYLLVRLISVRTQHQLRMTIVVFAVGLAIPLIWSGMIGFSYLQMYQAGLAYQGLGYKGALVSPRVFLKSLVYAFYLSLPVAFLGFIKIDNDKFKILLEMLVSALPLLLLWPTLPEGRFSFLLFPAVIPLAAIGLRDTAISLSNRPLLKELDTKQWLILLTLFIVVFNTYLTLARYGRFPWGP
jgi:4-amino-4-deoxy-L-arabinose transferase-like glycosyltransferase